MDGRITVYVPKELLNEVMQGRRPAQYWLSRPDAWNKDDIVEAQIPMETYQEWSKGRVSGKQLLKG